MTVYGESLGVSYQVLQTPLNQEDFYYQPAYQPQVDRIHQRMMIILAVVLVLVGVAVLTVTIPRLLKPDDSNQSTAVETTNLTEATGVNGNTAVAVAGGGISPVFSPQIQHWAPQIVTWSAQYGLDPDIVATIMQIESCGDPQAVSNAGAQGLFQVSRTHPAIFIHR